MTKHHRRDLSNGSSEDLDSIEKDRYATLQSSGGLPMEPSPHVAHHRGLTKSRAPPGTFSKAKHCRKESPPKTLKINSCDLRRARGLLTV